MYVLTVETGPNIGQSYHLTKPVYVLGRHPECDIVLDAGALSRKHCQLTLEGQDYFVEDLKSRNHSYVNEQMVTSKQRLRDGDQLRLCDVTFTYRLVRPSKEPTATSALPETPHSSLFELVDDNEQESTIMSKIDLSKSSSNWTTSAEVKLAAFAEIAKSLGKAVSLDAVLATILDSLFKIFLQADRGFVVLKEADGRLVPRWTKVRREGIEDSIRISRTIVRHVMEKKEAILSADATNDTRFELSQSIADFRIRSMMCAPLLDADGEALGTFQIDTLDQRKRFQADDLDLFASIAAQAAAAIQNAQLNERAQKQRQIERDMELAREVQRGFLPNRKPVVAGYQFFDYYQPMDQVGGDYFDYLVLPDGRLAVMVADVVGHGIAAALLMAKLSAECRISLLSETKPAVMVTKLNRHLSELELNRFVTYILAVIEPRTHVVTVVSAGHMAPIVRRASGLIEEPGGEVAGLPLGILADVEYEQFEFALGPGDNMVLYTDGINECMNSGGAFYSIERLRDEVQRNGRDAAEMGDNLVKDVRAFLGRTPQNDDMCLVCCGRPN